jgi:hypothetical protein
MLLVVSVALLVPAGTPPIVHAYVGLLPPFTGVAVKVKEDPAHVGFVPLVSAMLTDGVTVGFTVIVMLFDVAVDGEAHVALDVSTQVTI